jgi:hypothetical protein
LEQTPYIIYFHNHFSSSDQSHHPVTYLSPNHLIQKNSEAFSKSILPRHKTFSCDASYILMYEWNRKLESVIRGLTIPRSSVARSKQTDCCVHSVGLQSILRLGGPSKKLMFGAANCRSSCYNFPNAGDKMSKSDQRALF